MNDTNHNALKRKDTSFVFARHEVKYRVPAEAYRELLRQARENDLLEPDAYPHSNILSIYYDTEHNDLISRSLDRPAYKEKLRLRSYGVPTQNTLVFPELKKKYNGIVYKRRAEMPYGEAERFLNMGFLADRELEKDQIIQELIYFRDFYRPQPRLFIAYNRDSFLGTHYPDLRVTFDHNIRFREDRLHLADGDDGETLDLNGDYLMEVKAQDAIPLEFVRILSGMGLRPFSFSKYGSIYRAMHEKESARERKGICLPVSLIPKQAV